MVWYILATYGLSPLPRGRKTGPFAVRPVCSRPCSCPCSPPRHPAASRLALNRTSEQQITRAWNSTLYTSTSEPYQQDDVNKRNSREDDIHETIFTVSMIYLVLRKPILTKRYSQDPIHKTIFVRRHPQTRFTRTRYFSPRRYSFRGHLHETTFPWRRCPPNRSKRYPHPQKKCQLFS